MKLTTATEKDLDLVYSSFASRKDLFPHIRKDYVARQILKGTVVFYKSVFIIYDRYSRKVKLGTFEAQKDNYILHQIVNTNQGNGLASKVFDAWVKTLDNNLVLTVRRSNKPARRFYKHKGMKNVGDISWSGGTLEGKVYYLATVADADDTVSEDTQKPWQKGIPLETLDAAVKEFASYNKHSFSRFVSMGRDKIALSISTDSLHIIPKACAYATTKVKVSTEIKMCNDTIISRKQPGDLVLSCFSVTDRKLAAKHLLKLNDDNIWILCMAEDRDANKACVAAKFIKMGVQCKSTGELLTIYFKTRVGRKEIPLHKSQPLETLTIPRLHRKYDVEGVLSDMKLDFETHPSKSNKNNTWSALSVYGYSKDPKNIHDPDSAPAAWKNCEFTKLQKTPLWKKIPLVEEVLESLGNPEHKRIRIMQLLPGEGELTRHTDLISKEFGTSLGKLVRLHVPIITNPDVKFTVWDYHGDEVITHMKLGNLYYLDTRKPHSAKNGGDTTRIHLVLDIVVNKKVQKLLTKSL